MIQAAPFDAAAATYDADFTATPLGRALRERVRARLAQFTRGDRVLELGCGTGVDAVWLAKRGVRVLATDVSSAMLAETHAKAQAARVTEWVETRILDLDAPPDPLGALGTETFNGIFSNFGALNCVQDLHPLAQFLARSITPSGKLIFVVMNPVCLWEIAAHLAHSDFKNAFRRLTRAGAIAHIVENPIRVFYPSPRTLARAFTPNFRITRVQGIGILLPPPYLSAFAARHPRWIEFAARIEPRLAEIFPFNWLGDHYLIELTRI